MVTIINLILNSFSLINLTGLLPPFLIVVQFAHLADVSLELESTDIQWHDSIT